MLSTNQQTFPQLNRYRVRERERKGVEKFPAEEIGNRLNGQLNRRGNATKCADPLQQVGTWWHGGRCLLRLSLLHFGACCVRVILRYLNVRRGGGAVSTGSIGAVLAKWTSNIIRVCSTHTRICRGGCDSMCVCVCA